MNSGGKEGKGEREKGLLKCTPKLDFLINKLLNSM
jgi:hypothetical protein